MKKQIQGGRIIDLLFTIIMGLVDSVESLASVLEEIVVALLIITIILSLFLQMLMRYILNLLFDAVGLLLKRVWRYTWTALYNESKNLKNE